MTQPDDNSLAITDYFLLLIVISAIGYGLQLLIPVFTALHMPLIAIAVLLVGFLGYLVSPSRFIDVVRVTGMFVIAMSILRFGLGILFAHQYDTLAAKAGSAATFIFLYQQINASNSKQDKP